MTEEGGTRKLKAWGPNCPRGTCNSDHSVSVCTAWDTTHPFSLLDILAKKRKDDLAQYCKYKASTISHRLEC